MNPGDPKFHPHFQPYFLAIASTRPSRATCPIEKGDYHQVNTVPLISDDATKRPRTCLPSLQKTAPRVYVPYFLFCLAKRWANRWAYSGGRETPTCKRCQEAGRPCTRRFDVRFSSRRIWTPRARSRSRSPTASPEARTRVSVAPQQLSSPSRSPRAATYPESHLNTDEAEVLTFSPASTGYASSLVELTSEDVFLLQYFGDFIGRQW